MIESDREKQWQRDELARKLEQAHAEIVKLNNQIAQAVINSIRGDA